MKKKLFTLLLALFAIATTARAQVAINATNFPDEKFRSFVSSNYDTDKNGYLSTTEIAAVPGIRVDSKNIANLKGIEFFTGAQYLYCQDNQLTSLDVSKNTKLMMLFCYNNRLTKLDVSKNTKLKTLNFQMNQVASIDLSKNTALTGLYCNNNKLTALDVSKSPNLTTLYCYSNQIKGDKMQALVNNLPTVSDGKFRAIDTKDSNEKNVITKSQVAIAKGKGWTVYDYNNGSAIEYAGSDPTDIAINATNFPDEKFRSFVSSNYDTDNNGYLSTTEIAAVKEIDVSYKGISNLKGIEYFTALTELDCDHNQLTSLDVSKNTALTVLGCSYNQLTSLDVSKNTALTELYCWHNQLTSLDVSKNTALTVLDCADNKLTELNLSTNTELTTLYCYVNQIKGDKMLALVNSLPTVSGISGDFYVIDTKDSNEQNDITKAQVAIAKGKNWTVYDYNGGSPQEYAGSDETNSIDAPLNDNGKMINDSWYTIDGKKLNGEPKKKGLYIHKGKKVVK